MVKTGSTMLAYEVKAITGGTDAQGEVVVRLREGDFTVMGQGSDTDIIVASAKAYINALNKLEYLKKRGEKTVEKMCEYAKHSRALNNFPTFLVKRRPKNF